MMRLFVRMFNTSLRNGIQGRSHATTRYKYLRPTMILVGTGSTVYLVDKHAYSSLGERSVRAMSVLLWVAYEYSFNANKYSLSDDLHEATAEALLELMTTNKGLYIKLGQAIANQGSIFPPAYQKRFPQLYDNAPVDDWATIDATLKKNLGANYESELFESIDHVPVASASIAQVHKATLKNKQEVALKVQHDYIQTLLVVDLWVYRFISRVYQKVFDIPLTFFTSYVSDQLVKETNFEIELQNSERLASLIAADTSFLSVYVPWNMTEVCTKQVLVTEWIDGYSLSNKEGIIDAKFDLKQLMTDYLAVFGKQIYDYGFIHSDPHPGNLMVRRHNGKQQLVILDHGLYISLPDDFRTDYCNLWKYMFLMNFNGITEIATKWGIQSPEIFATAVQLRPVTRLEGLPSRDTRDFKSLFQDFIGDQKKFPLELLFLSRAMRMMQNMNQVFGSPVNRVNLLTKVLIDALRSEGSINRWELFKIKTTMFFSDVLFLWVRFRQILLGDRYGGKGAGLEDYIEVYMQNTAKSLGMVVT